MTRADNLAAAREETRACTYKLFRNIERPELCCAIPEDLPVPRFLATGWTFERALPPDGAAPAGFHNRAARAGVRYNGFYVFQLVAR